MPYLTSLGVRDTWQVRLPKVTDRGTLLVKMNDAFGGNAAGRGGHPAYRTDYRTREAKESLFTVRHYAGDVVYCIDNFLEKSLENISAELVGAVSQSTSQVVASLFNLSASHGGASSRQASVGLKFSKQLARLIETIDSTQPHFIRCVKPNALKSPTAFNEWLTLEQLRYSGLFEAVAIRKCGYPFRMTHKEFNVRFRLIVPIAAQAQLGFDVGGADAARQTSEKLSQMLPDVSPLYAEAAKQRGANLVKNMRIGKTRIFYRAAESRALEGAREKRLIPLLQLAQRMSRGAVARRVRRALAELRRALNAAVAAKILEPLEAALAEAQIPQRGFSKGKMESFPLPIPNMTYIAALLTDLRREPELEREIAALCAADDLAAQYEKLLPLLDEALELAEPERLGRAVPSMEKADTIVGLTQGIEDHDHERLEACLAASERLGLAARLVQQSKLAREEIKRLEEGRVFETAISNELAKGRSTNSGGGVWNHAAVAVPPLQGALDKGVQFPLVSKSGLRLVATARAAIEIRKAISAKDWKALVGTLDGVKAAAAKAKEGGSKAAAKGQPRAQVRAAAIAREIAVEIEKYDEVASAWAELKDVCAVREKALEGALSVGRSKRIGDMNWSHVGIDSAGLSKAKEEVASFVYVTDAGKTLLSLAGLALQIRTALLKCEWGKASTWEPLAVVIEELATHAMRNEDEVKAAFRELADVRQTTENAVQEAFENGRSTKRPDGKWSHDKIDSSALEAALRELNGFPRPSEKGRALAASAARVVKLRAALQRAALEEPFSWRAVGDVLDKAADAGDKASDQEMNRGRDELDDARKHYEGLVSARLATNRAVRAGGAADVLNPAASWERGSISSSELASAIEVCDKFPRPKESTKALIKTARFVCELRTELKKTDWERPASWTLLARFLDGAVGTVRDGEKSEYDDAVAQLEAMGAKVEEGMRRALKTGRSVEGANGWSHEGIEVATLTAAIGQCETFPRPSAGAKALLAGAKLVVTLRESLVKVVPGNVSTWAPLAKVLSATPADDLAIAEVRAALVEFRQARDKVVESVNAAMRNGGSRPPPAGKRAWDHSAIDADGVVQSAIQLEHFPRIDRDAAAAPAGDAHARRESLALKRTSLARQDAEVAELVSSAKRLGRLREVLLSEDWAEVHACIGDLEKAAGSLHEAANDEVKRAAQELHDVGASLDEAVQLHMETGRSKDAKDKSGFWDHSALAVEPLRAAVDALGGYPLKGEASDALLLKARAVLALREVLMRKAWGELARMIPTLAGEITALDEVRAAATELEEMRGATEAELQAAVKVGRSSKNVGTKKLRVGTEWFVNVDWEHGGMAEGLERLSMAVENVRSFPEQRDGIQAVLDAAEHAVAIRTHVLAADWPALRTQLEKHDDSPIGKVEEAGMAWQELLCHELTAATGHRGPPIVPADQALLKLALAEATVRGLLPHEAPVFRALDKFIDPPEFKIDLDYPSSRSQTGRDLLESTTEKSGGDVYPDPVTGQVVLKVKVRGFQTLRWLKNNIAMKEGADGGRITGVATEELTFTKIVGRDTDQKVWCEATNKWGTVTSKVVYLRIPDASRPIAPANVGGDVRVVSSVADKMKVDHKKKLGEALGALPPSASSTTNMLRAAVGSAKFGAGSDAEGNGEGKKSVAIDAPDDAATKERSGSNSGPTPLGRAFSGKL